MSDYIITIVVTSLFIHSLYSWIKKSKHKTFNAFCTGIFLIISIGEISHIIAKFIRG